MSFSSQSKAIINLLKKIPRGKIATYGQIASMAGNPRAARQVARLLHSSSQKYSLPWHRVINAKGRISLPWNSGGAEQVKRLKAEGVQADKTGKYDIGKYGWRVYVDGAFIQ